VKTWPKVTRNVAKIAKTSTLLHKTDAAEKDGSIRFRTRNRNTATSVYAQHKNGKKMQENEFQSKKYPHLLGNWVRLIECWHQNFDWSSQIAMSQFLTHAVKIWSKMLPNCDDFYTISTLLRTTVIADFRPTVKITLFLCKDKMV